MEHLPEPLDTLAKMLTFVNHDPACKVNAKKAPRYCSCGLSEVEQVAKQLLGEDDE